MWPRGQLSQVMVKKVTIIYWYTVNWDVSPKEYVSFTWTVIVFEKGAFQSLKRDVKPRSIVSLTVHYVLPILYVCIQRFIYHPWSLLLTAHQPSMLLVEMLTDSISRQLYPLAFLIGEVQVVSPHLLPFGAWTPNMTQLWPDWAWRASVRCLATYPTYSLFLPLFTRWWMGIDWLREMDCVEWAAKVKMCMQIGKCRISRGWGEHLNWMSHVCY